MTLPTRVVVLGPTASGKSDVAMAAATEVPNVHIVAADAIQVYRRMDVGSAKPTSADRAAVVHHGIDLCEPSERFTVARYVEEVATARQAITAAGAIGFPAQKWGCNRFGLAMIAESKQPLQDDWHVSNFDAETAFAL